MKTENKEIRVLIKIKSSFIMKLDKIISELEAFGFRAEKKIDRMCMIIGYTPEDSMDKINSLNYVQNIKKETGMFIYKCDEHIKVYSGEFKKADRPSFVWLCSECGTLSFDVLSLRPEADYKLFTDLFFKFTGEIIKNK